MSGSDRVDNQFAGQLEFSQATLFAGHYDFVKLFPGLWRSYFGRLFYKGDGLGRAGRNTNTTSKTAIKIHHCRLFFLGNAHSSDLAAFRTDTASFAGVPVHSRIKV